MILSAAAQHQLGLARAPKALPAAARNAVFRSLIKTNLLTEIDASREHVGLGWRQDDDGTWIVARITDEGLRAIGIDPKQGDAVADTAPPAAPEAEPATRDEWAAEAAHAAPLAPATTPRAILRVAAAEVLAAWADNANHEGDMGNMIAALHAPMGALRAILAGKPVRTPRGTGAPRKPREGTKQEQVLALLRRPEGATVAQVMKVTGWAPHTVRGFFAGLKKRQGIAVEVLERVRQVGPNKTGAEGSYTFYQIATGPA